MTDSFYFVHQPLTGNGSITARVTSLTGELPTSATAISARPAGRGMHPGLEPWAKAGSSSRPSTQQGSAYAAVMVTGGHGVRMQYDFTQRHRRACPARVSAASPRWLRLTRSGDTLTGYESADGTHWARSARYAGRAAVDRAGRAVRRLPGYTVDPALRPGDQRQRRPHHGHRRLRPRQPARRPPGGAWAGTAVGDGGPAARTRARAGGFTRQRRHVHRHRVRRHRAGRARRRGAARATSSRPCSARSPG